MMRWRRLVRRDYEQRIDISEAMIHGRHEHAQAYSSLK